MPKLCVTVVDAPTDFAEQGLTELTLIAQGAKENFEGVRNGPDYRFELEIDLSPEGVPRGQLIRRENDGRRFFYLQWWGSRNGHRETFRRIKVFFGEMAAWPGDPEVRISGRDRKGGPACARATVLPTSGLGG